MPTFNRATLIAESLQAILAQAGEDDEILVLDDGSTDATEAVVRGLAPRVRYARQSNAGKSAALNRALALTNGDYVWICDDDDILRPGAVALLVAALGASRADYVFGRHERFRVDPMGNRMGMATGYWPDLASGTLARHILEDAFVMQNAALVRRRCYARTGPFHEAFLRSQDYEMFVRLALMCDGVFVDAVIFDQRKHDGARGPTGILHAADHSDEIWSRFDRMIFEVNAGQLTPAIFEAMFEGTAPELVRRAALLQRACVEARHGSWPTAIGTLTAASELLANRPVHAVERAICGRLVAGKHGFAGVLAAGTPDALRQLLRGPPAAASIGRAVLSGLFWRLRRDTPQVRRAAWRLLIATAGYRGGINLLAEHLVVRGGGNREADQLREKSAPRFAPAAHGFVDGNNSLQLPDPVRGPAIVRYR